MTATVKISELTASAGVSGNDVFVSVTGGPGSYATHKVTAAQLAAHVTSSIVNLSVNSITGSFSGNGASVTNLTASNISNFASDVRSQFSAGTGIALSSGQISIQSVPVELLSSQTVTVGTTSITLGGSATTIQGVSVITGSIVTGSTAQFTTLNAATINGKLNGFITPVSTVSSNSTLLTSQYVILADATSGNVTLTLPDATQCINSHFAVKKIDSSANTIMIVTTSGQTIDGSATRTITTQYEALLLVNNGQNWFIF